jgi:hypothetical protein
VLSSKDQNFSFYLFQNLFRNTSEDDLMSRRVPSASSLINDKRFAYSLLERLLEYVERASSTMQNYKESSRYSLHETYRLTTKDVKFFGKVKEIFLSSILNKISKK